VLQLVLLTNANSAPGWGRVELGVQRKDDALGLFHSNVVSSGLPAAREGLNTNSPYPGENFLNPVSMRCSILMGLI
jgi:hypothetical protein